MTAPLTVLITRPQPQAGRLAQVLAGQGVQVVVAPLMRAEALPVVLPEGPFTAVILTSEAGALAAGPLCSQLPARAFCVGDHTAGVERAQGFDARALGETADQLLAALTGKAGPFLYLRGRNAAADIAGILTARGQTAISVEVYAQIAEGLTAEATSLLTSPGNVVIPLYSARSARLFLAASPPDSCATLHMCVIAPPVLIALPEPLQARAIVAERPDGPAMQAAILRVIRSLLS